MITKEVKKIRIKNILVILMFIGTLLAFSGIVSAASGLADSPQPKFHNNNNNTGQSQYKGPQTNTTRWIYNTSSSNMITIVTVN